MNYTGETVVLLLVVNVLYLVSPIEPPSSSRRNMLHVDVQPKHSILHAGESIVVRCLVNSGVRKDNFPRIGIFLQLDEHTVIPLTSDTPGVSVTTVPAAGANSKYGRYSKSITYVTIGEEIHFVLGKAENHFVCVASTPVGEHQKDYFTVWKVPYAVE